MENKHVSVDLLGSAFFHVFLRKDSGSAKISHLAVYTTYNLGPAQTQGW